MSALGAYIILSIVIGVVCYLIALKKGRNAALWFVGGVIFSIFGVALLLWSKNLNIQNPAQKRN